MPRGVVKLATIVNVALHVGLQLDENDAVAPLGSPDALKVTGAGVPESRDAVTLKDADAPCFTETDPPDNEKLNGGGGGGEPAPVVKVESEESVVWLLEFADAAWK